ncbi:hypothetical protein JRO89_XS01G0158600 [Xanthoceras sorbifolium]|uniref:Uncharacterized protein n=1 Tax=Xanthoceras sorbifolium TaxID=99658 RepID=A0ABQ8IJG3_9ROSI|nr:hypothetical protein JRO89_XS01G0158600 [Xanthoceras sorbifolium]
MAIVAAMVNAVGFPVLDRVVPSPLMLAVRLSARFVSWRVTMLISASNGASAHMTPTHSSLDQPIAYTGKDCVIVGNESPNGKGGGNW